MHLLKCFSIAVLLVFPPLLRAQPGPPEERHEGQRGFERIEQLKKIRLIEILDMKEEPSVRFMARMTEHDSTRRKLVKERGEALDRLERLVRNEAEAREYQKGFDEISSLDARIQDEQKRFFASLTDILTPIQRAKLLLFERRFERELREAMREAQRRRHGSDSP